MPWEYPWSNYNVYGDGKEDGLTDRDDIYEVLGDLSKFMCLGVEFDIKELP